MGKIDIEQILKDNHFNALNILSKAHCKDGISGTEKDRLLNGIKAIIEKTVEITLDEVVNNVKLDEHYRDNPYDPKSQRTIVVESSITGLKDNIIKQLL